MAPSTTAKDPAASSPSRSQSSQSQPSQPPRAASSLFSCGYDTTYTCGLEEPFETTLDTMRRASFSRRQQAFASPPVRSRSQERFGNDTHRNDQLLDRQEVSLADTDEDAALDLDDDADDTNGQESPSSREMAVQDVRNSTTNNNNNNNSGSNNSQRGIHHRAMSDPFDTQEWKEAVQEVQDFDDSNNNNNNTLTEAALAGKTAKASLASSSHHKSNNNNSNAYPTLLRYPVAESRNKNCWSEPPVHIFSVRGPNYFKDKNSKKSKKVPSGPYLLTARGTDIFLFDKKPVLLEERSHLILGGQLRSRPTLLINFKFPWGVMVLYFEVPAKLAPYLNDPATPLTAALTHSERTLAKWFKGNQEYKNDRLKLIPYVAEGPWVVRNMVTGRPAIIGRKLPVKYRTLPGKGTEAPLCECTLDIGSSSATAKRIVSVCRRYMSGLTSDIGFVIQAESPEELPEQMMGAMRVHGPDPLKAPKIA